MGSIYKITNDINDKIYIGQTINDINYRFRCHINEARQCDHQNKFHLALLEIGPEHFKTELIETCDNDKLNEREQYWIKYFDSVNNGYNTTWGGSCGISYDRNNLLKLWNEGLNIGEISNIVGIDRGLLGQILKQLGITQEEILKRRDLSNTRQIYQIDINSGQTIQQWPSINAAAKYFDLNQSSIVKCCTLHSKTVKGYTWRYIEDYNPLTDAETLVQYVKHIPSRRKTVLQYDKENHLLNTFSSTKEAGEILQISPNNIARYCRGERIDPNGFIWKYKNKGEKLYD